MHVGEWLKQVEDWESGAPIWARDRRWVWILEGIRCQLEKGDSGGYVCPKYLMEKVSKLMEIAEWVAKKTAEEGDSNPEWPEEYEAWLKHPCGWDCWSKERGPSSGGKVYAESYYPRPRDLKEFDERDSG